MGDTMKNVQRRVMTSPQELVDMGINMRATKQEINCQVYLLLSLVLFVSLFFLSATFAQATESPERVVTAFLVTAYDYDPGASGGDIEMGRSICATQCNAFSTDYLNYSEAGGWRIIKMASQEQLRLEIKNPFMDGDCLCTADRYEIRINELSYPDRNILGEKIDHEFESGQ